MGARVWLSVMCVTQMFGTPLAARHTMEPARGGGAAPSLMSATLPVRFERNDGQTDPRVEFLAQGSGYALFLTQSELVLSTGRIERRSGSGSPAPRRTRRSKGSAA